MGQEGGNGGLVWYGVVWYGMGGEKDGEDGGRWGRGYV